MLIEQYSLFAAIFESKKVQKNFFTEQYETEKLPVLYKVIYQNRG